MAKPKPIRSGSGLARAIPVDPVDVEINRAIRRGRELAETRPKPLAVSFDRTSGALVIAFAGGGEFRIPARDLQGLAEASDEALSDVRLRGRDGIHWPQLDADFSISGLLAGRTGGAGFMAEKGRQAPERT